MKSMKVQLDAAKKDMARTTHPTAYLIAQLRDEEDAKNAALYRIGNLNEELDRTREDLRLCQGEGMELKERLSVLLQQRSELDRLRGLLETWKEEEPEDEDEEEEEGVGEEEYDVSNL